jgi:DNA excision repair protein ERCC-2
MDTLSPHHSNRLHHTVALLLTLHSYLERIITAWKESNVLDKIYEKKLIFLETKDVVETTLALDNFKKACDSGRGAIFFSVARGKVSSTAV